MCEERPESPSDSTDETQTAKKSTKKESVCQVSIMCGSEVGNCGCVAIINPYMGMK